MTSIPWSWNLPGRRRLRRKSVDANAVTQAGFGGEDEDTEWVDVYWAATIEQAHIVRGALEAEDIPAMLKSRESSLVYGSTALYGVGVYVPRAFEDRALTLLGEEGGD